MTARTARTPRGVALATVRGLDEALGEAEVAIARAEPDPAVDDAEVDALLAREHNLRFARGQAVASYLATLPPVPVSRCPLTDEVVALPIDLAGFDGLFWDARHPVRGRPVDRPRTLIAWTGAVRFDEDRLPTTRHLVKPGPAVPYVVPELLADDAVVAVVSSVPVGGHEGWLIAYYAPGGDGHLRWNEWGADRWMDADAIGSVDEDEDAWDTDLAPWIADDRVRWIAPGDPDLSIRGGVDGCPYVGLQGTPRMQRLQSGELWTLDDL